MPPAPTILDLAPAQVDLRAGRVDGPRPGRLTGLEIKLLEALVCAEGAPLDRSQLLREVWGNRGDGAWRAVDAAVYRLRRKIEVDPADPQWILSVRTGGYRLVPPRPRPAGLVDARERELVLAVSALTAGERLCVTGLPGVGRTWFLERLAERLGLSQARRVDVAGESDPARVATRIAVALHATASEARDLKGVYAAIAARLAENTTLLLDDAPGEGTVAVLDALRGLRPTLRAARVGDAPARGERLITLGAFEEPAAIELFEAIATSSADTSDRDAMRRIVTATGGLALPLVLAASAVRWIGADAVAATFAGVGSVELDRLLHAATSLLPTPERDALVALSLPAGSFGPDGAAALIGPDALTLLASLVARGWVVRDVSTFHLLPPVRGWVRGALEPPSERVIDRWRSQLLDRARAIPAPHVELERFDARRAMAPFAADLLELNLDGLAAQDRARVAVLVEAWLEGSAEFLRREAILLSAAGGLDPGSLPWAEVQAALARLHRGFGDWGQAARLLDPLVRTLDPAGRVDAHGDADLLWASAVAQRHGGQFARPGSAEILVRATAVARACGHAILEGHLVLSAAERRWREQGATAGETHAAFVTAGALLEAAGDLSGATLAQLHRSTLLQESGRWTEAREARHLAAILHGRSRDRYFEGAMYANQAFDAVADHDLGSAEAAMRLSLAEEERRGRHSTRPFHFAQLALLRLHRGALADAVALGGEALIAAGSGEGRAQIQERVDIVFALATLERGDLAAARALARTARVNVGEPANTLLAGVEAVAAARLGERAAAEDVLDAGRTAAAPVSAYATFFLACCAVVRGESLTADTLASMDGVLPGHGAMFRHRLTRAPAPEPAAPGDPADERHALLRLARAVHAGR